MLNKIAKPGLSVVNVLAVIVSACSTTTDGGLPDPIGRLIDGYERAPEDASPQAVWKYSYRGAEVFYIPLSSVCCDRFSELYDREGNLICAPDGGITGDGDGRCPDFVPRPAEGVQVWTDSRPR